jgi:hypothetical protein
MSACRRYQVVGQKRRLKLPAAHPTYEYYWRMDVARDLKEACCMVGTVDHLELLFTLVPAQGSEPFTPWQRHAAFVEIARRLSLALVRHCSSHTSHGARTALAGDNRCRSWRARTGR